MKVVNFRYFCLKRDKVWMLLFAPKGLDIPSPGQRPGKSRYTSHQSHEMAEHKGWFAHATITNVTPLQGLFYNRFTKPRALPWAWYMRPFQGQEIKISKVHIFCQGFLVLSLLKLIAGDNDKSGNMGKNVSDFSIRHKRWSFKIIDGFNRISLAYGERSRCWTFCIFLTDLYCYCLHNACFLESV